ncbi:glycosyltransferase family 39 protein [Aquifex pyrophilus]
MFKYVLGINLLLAVLRILYILLYPIDLSPEEAQYWDWSRHLDLSYYSKPPMVAYMNFLSTAIFGNTELGVRINAVLLSFLLSLITYKFVKEIYDEKTAFLSSVIPNILLGFSINSLLFTTDSPLIFFWALSLIFLYKAVEENRLIPWIFTGIFGGLAFLSKYPAVFLLPLGVLYVFIVRRELLRDIKIYSSIFVAFILSLPVLIWNIKHDFISFRHVSNLADKGSSFPNISAFLEFLGGQVLILSLIPFFFVIYGWFKTFFTRDKRDIFLTVFSFPVFLFFLLLSLKKRVYANWPDFGYYTAVILFSRHFLNAPKFLKVITIFIGVFLTILIHFTPLLDLIGLRKLLPPKRDPTKFLVGWEKLGKEVSELHTKDKFILSSAYQISAELAFYVDGNPRTYVYHVNRYTQYYLWREGLKSYKGSDALFVSYGGIPKELMKSFKDKAFIKRVDIFWRGKRVRSFYIYLLKGFKGELYEKPEGY